MPMANKDAQREYQRQWIARRRVEYFADKVCAECGTADGLELDHKDPAQKVSHSIWSWSAERRTAELAKCQVLCHDCHWRKTLAHDRKRTDHGRAGMYANGCRCASCRDWKSKAASPLHQKMPTVPLRVVSSQSATGRNVRATHGGRSMYQVYRCRCEDCREWCRQNSTRRNQSRAERTRRFRGSPLAA